jgi:DNA (cytosine-5)-methyltransferase 1
MKTVELFAGIGGFRIASDELGLDTVWANDICPLAQTVYHDRFGDREFKLGDIHELKAKIPKHDVLTGGFPCQPFSSAGKKQGIKDPRGTLFSNIVDILAKQSPRYFILENVKRLLTMDRGTHFATILSALSELNYRIEWRLLNAVHFGLPQNRQRVIIVGHRESPNRRNPFVSGNCFTTSLASESDLLVKKISRTAIANTATWIDIANHGRKFASWGLAWKGSFVNFDLPRFSEATAPVLLQSVLQDESEIDPQFDFTESTLERLTKSERVDRFVEGVEILSNQGGGARMGYTVFGVNGLAPTLTATPSRHYERYKIGEAYRRLTNIEYARIQGFPDDHCSSVSVYSQYSLFGNAVPPPMVKWALKSALAPKQVDLDSIPSPDSQLELFA